MNREQYAEMLKTISEVHRAGGDVHKCIMEYREKYKYVYIYNDSIFKMLFGNPANMRMTASFLNAILKLDGGDCIDNLTFVNPAENCDLTVVKTSANTTKKARMERIELRVLHDDRDFFQKSLVFFTERKAVSTNLCKSSLWSSDFSLISLLLFGDSPDSEKYRHCLFFESEENKALKLNQNIIFIEVLKFIKGCYTSDESRLAQWLRVIDSLNNETPIGVAEDVSFVQLQKNAELINYDDDYFLKETLYF